MSRRNRSRDGGEKPRVCSSLRPREKVFHGQEGDKLFQMLLIEQVSRPLGRNECAQEASAESGKALETLTETLLQGPLIFRKREKERRWQLEGEAE